MVFKSLQQWEIGTKCMLSTEIVRAPFILMAFFCILNLHFCRLICVLLKIYFFLFLINLLKLILEFKVTLKVDLT